MRKIILGISAAVLSTGIPGWAAAQQNAVRQDNTAYGTTAAEFLLMAPTGRGAALGASYAALATDVSAMYYNPAGLAQLTRMGIMGSTMSYVADTKLNWVGFAIPFGGGSRAVGFQVTSFGFSDQRVYTVDDPEGLSGEVYTVNQTALGFTYAQQFSDRFSAGLNAKFINDQLGRAVGRAFALDLGTNFHASVGGRPLRASFVIQNLGTTMTHTGNALDVTVNRAPPSSVGGAAQEPQPARLQTKSWSLPVMFRVGLSYDVFTTSSSRLTALGEFSQPNNTDPGYNFAGEYNIRLGQSGFQLAGRLGYTSSPDNNLEAPDATSPDYAGFASSVGAGSDGLSAGGGLHWQKNPRALGLGFDYAYKNMGLLGNVNMVTFSLDW